MKNMTQQHKTIGLIVAFGGITLLGATANAELITPFDDDHDGEMWGLDGPKYATPDESEPKDKGGKVGHTDQGPVGRKNETDDGFFRGAMMAGPGMDGTGGVPSDPFGTDVSDTEILEMLLDVALEGAGDLGGRAASIEFDAFNRANTGGSVATGPVFGPAVRGAPTPGSAVLLVMGGAAAFGRRRRI